MKTLVILVLLGVVVALGGIFFEAWTIPGLEKFPTAKRLGMSRAESLQREAERRYGGEGELEAPPRWGKHDGGSLGTRARQVKESEANLGN
jgi:hypothetical protein